MGILSSKDSRRVSFDNTFAITPVINIQKSIKDDNVIKLERLRSDHNDELHFKDSNVSVKQYQEEGDGDYWAQRMDCLKKEHQSINKIIETEYEKTIENTNQKFESPKVANDRLLKMKPCIDVRAKILQCYEENPRQPLVCSTLVQAFSQCVSTCRREN